MDEIERYVIASECGDYKELAIRLASNYRTSKKIIVAALYDDNETFANEFLLRVFTAVDDGQVPQLIASFRYERIAELFRGKFERIAQEIIAEYLCEIFKLPDQFRNGFEWNPWTDKPADTHFESLEINEAAA